MIWQLLEGRDVTPKYMLCGCPKHGLHLLSGLVQGYVRPLEPSIFNQNHWTGTFKLNSFAPVWQEMERWFFMASRLQQGFYTQGHIGYRPDISDYLRLSRVAFVFIYRDLRDAAVSMAHHILRSDDDSRHPAKNTFKALGGFDDILMACIKGLGPYPGAVGLWELYSKWLQQDWILSIKFEDAIANLEATATSIIEYGLDQITRGIWEAPFVVEASKRDVFVKQMVAIAQRKDLSPTFRNGVAGEWQEVFKPEHKAAFKETDKAGWLQQLGYASGDNW